MKREERQPLLLADPLNDVYERESAPRPDIRASPDSTTLPIEASTPENRMEPTCKDNSYNPILDRDLEHPTS
jgi:hypothetical protein